MLLRLLSRFAQSLLPFRIPVDMANMTVVILKVALRDDIELCNLVHICG